MPFVGKGSKNANSQGWLRDSKYFFNELSKTHPELFSDTNMRAIANGDIPVVDEQFLKYFPQYEEYFGNVIRHHHIGGGSQATPVPKSIHEGSGGIHNVEKSNGIWGGIDATNSEFLQAIKELTGRTKQWKNVRIKP